MHLRIVAAVCAAGLSSVAAGSAAAQETPPEWLKRPTPDMLRGVWPKASMNGVRGLAVIHCKVSLQGLLFDCRVVREEPDGGGFGAAAVALTPQLLMKPARKDGKPVVGEVRIPIRFSDGPEGDTPSGFGAKPVLRPSMAWKRAPTYAEVAAAYPQKAKAAGVGGLASVDCRLNGFGTVQSCEVTREEPKGYGFGLAARSLTRLFEAFPLADGKSLMGAVVTIPVAFDPVMLRTTTAVVGKPTWERIPSAEVLSAAFPTAPENVTTVRVVLQCQVQQGGSLEACQVQMEEPAAAGLGAAALKVVPEFRLGTWSMEGLPVVGGRVNIPLRYEFKAPATPAQP